MSSKTNPEYRLRNLRRRLADLLMGRRLSVDPERTGIVELADFGKRCQVLADFCGQSVADLASARGEEAKCVLRLAEELELAARLAARMETLEQTTDRVDRQARILEEVQRSIDAALKAECQLEEPEAMISLSTIARSERKLFEPFVTFEGEILDAPPGMVDRGRVRRALRRALLEAAEDPFHLEIDGKGTLRFGEFEYRTEGASDALVRSPHEPPEVRRALDLREGTEDESLQDFLLVKAVDEALAAVVTPELQGHGWSERARALPRRPGKRAGVRPEAVDRPVEAWDKQEAARGADKLASRRIGPDWARLPKGAYLFRLFLSNDDRLAADLLALGPVLRRMEKGEAVEGERERAERALRGLLALLG
ncbi:MAG: hypothetical protein ACYTGV_09385 [Planctomycetota bacterium]|jgi:hypothetical protein